MNGFSPNSEHQEIRWT